MTKVDHVHGWQDWCKDVVIDNAGNTLWSDKTGQSQSKRDGGTTRSDSE